MPHVSITRLHLRRKLFVVPFAFATLAITRQLKRSPGFLGGMTAYEPGFCFWTASVWQDAAAMKAFRNSGSHQKAMKKLLTWCDEASYGNWQQADATLPELAEVHSKMLELGKTSKVKFPSSAHQEGRLASELVPAGKRPIIPKAA